MGRSTGEWGPEPSENTNRAPGKIEKPGPFPQIVAQEVPAPRNKYSNESLADCHWQTLA
jgi:hypothetical protein